MIESKENSATQLQREKLLDKSRELSSFVQEGRIVYLGTPQSSESIYNTLYGRGFDLRVWPGRVPTPKEMKNYMIGDHCVLAPVVQDMIKNGAKRTGYGLMLDRGQVVDPIMQNENKLTFQENDKGPANFDLQYMLNTVLSDADRFPLKLANLIFYGLNPKFVPGQILWAKNEERLHALPRGSYVNDKIYAPFQVSDELFEYDGFYISIDPSGGGANGDEMGYAVLYTCNGYIFLMECGGFKGGYEETELRRVIAKITQWGCHTAIIEKNYGNGAFGSALSAVMIKDGVKCSIEDVWSTGQKETRIIDALSPVMGIHKLIVNSSCLEHDLATTQHYNMELRNSYSWLYQMARITRDKACLVHDDRLEAISQGVKFLHDRIKIDSAKEEAKKVSEAHMQFVNDPLFRRANIRQTQFDGGILKRAGVGLGNVMNKFRR